MMMLPDTTPDLVQAAWRELMQISAALKAAGVGSDSVWDPWLFPWNPKLTVNGTGMCSIVLSSRGSWASPNTYNTLEFPSLQVEVYADIDRDSVHAPVARLAESKALDVWHVFDPVFHRPDRGDLEWGDELGTIRIVSSYRQTLPQIMDVPDTDGVVRLTAAYQVELG